MSRPTDFVPFYQQLGLSPQCSLVELKNAYRRRVAELHPDRNPQRRDDPAAAAQLQELTAAYQATLAFERRHGRLPGARPHVGPAGRPSLHPLDTTRRTGLRRVVFVALAAAAVGWVVWSQVEHEEPTRAQDPADERRFVSIPSAPVAAAPSAGGMRIEIGMEAAGVRAIEGRPVMESAERWDYGPSWIEFDHGRVSNWYSSRLRPLKVTSARPASR